MGVLRTWEGTCYHEAIRKRPLRTRDVMDVHTLSEPTKLDTGSGSDRLVPNNVI